MTVNLREGTRRLALLLGFLGAIAGGFASYLELQSVLSQQARHNRFEQLAASDVVTQERKTLQAWTPVAEVSPAWAKTKPVAPSYTHFVPDPSEVNKGGIRTINWGKGFEVSSIESDDGQTFYPTPAPSAWLYLLIALLPFVGFLIPWGTVRATGWVGTGFFQPLK